MKTLIYKGKGQVELQDVPKPDCPPGYALIQIEASAICGSERQALIHGYPGNTGHEACGIVVSPTTPSFERGQRVGLYAIQSCRKCTRCRSGQEIHCPTASVSSDWHSEFVALPLAALRRLPPGTPPDIGVLITGDTLGLPTRALSRAPSSPGETVLVVGLGPTGLGHIALRAHSGANVIALGGPEIRQRLALKLGASEVLRSPQHLRSKPSLVIECSGRAEQIIDALESVADGGTVIESAGCSTELRLPSSDHFVRREITHTGVFYYASENYDEMLRIATSGAPIRPICTHYVTAQRAQQSIDDFLDRQTGKVILQWS
ncbi:alcohol dehydrogenase catalytic domain-containing protein [Phytoactinopolyspora halotolerans]|uniref:Alcohol dehydrogenase catalytic domain-containing protein n=1 Tax=Phytoactinopolyspora halotolerans TaxID=1981512 RepID=A0A6L9SEP9_9ACTN|nr:alcohol dehydrogenase catalytic domain-containing protein [Phytoactinopolyspora halotolerans]